MFLREPARAVGVYFRKPVGSFRGFNDSLMLIYNCPLLLSISLVTLNPLLSIRLNLLFVSRAVFGFEAGYCEKCSFQLVQLKNTFFQTLLEHRVKVSTFGPRDKK